jgi:plastocyanin
MVRILVVIGAALALAVGAAASALGQGASTPTLKGTVGPGFTISLKKNGRKITTLKPGAYKVSVSDRSSMHNFTLERETKPQIEKHVTGTSFTGTRTITVTLKRGEWKFYCSIHEATMHGSFRVR